MADTPENEHFADLRQGMPLDAIPDNGFVEGRVGDEHVLLSRAGTEISAVGATCSHLGAPLGKGLLVDGTIRCPWHLACFDLRSGIALEAPAFDALPRWSVRIADGTVFVERKIRADPPAFRPVGRDKRVFLIVGGGAAGFAAAHSLRHHGFEGIIRMISMEDAAPYDRTLLTKDYLDGTFGDDRLSIARRSLQDLGVDFVWKARATALDPTKHELMLDDGRTFVYSKLLLATGGEPIMPDFAGKNRATTHLLRSLRDCRAILSRVTKESRVVLLGGSFIALEAAASLRDRGADVTVVAREEAPLAKVFGHALATAIRTVHEEHGNRFVLGRTIVAANERSVILDNEHELACDLLIVGVGVKPLIGIAADAKLEVANGIVVDRHLATSTPDIFAAGDIACWPDPHSGKSIRVEHWVVAERQGQIAARNMMGNALSFDDVPFFWTKHFDFSVRYLGHAEHWDETIVEGDINKRDCAIHYMEKGRRMALATVGRDDFCLIEREKMSRSFV